MAISKELESVFSMFSGQMTAYTIDESELCVLKMGVVAWGGHQKPTLGVWYPGYQKP